MEKDGFYNQDSSQYYMYKITLNYDLSIKKIEAVFENSHAYSLQLKKLIGELTFKKIDTSETECNEYILPFIVQARLKKLLYPKDHTFYDTQLPIEWKINNDFDWKASKIHEYA